MGLPRRGTRGVGRPPPRIEGPGAGAPPKDRRRCHPRCDGHARAADPGPGPRPCSARRFHRAGRRGHGQNAASSPGALHDRPPPRGILISLLGASSRHGSAARPAPAPDHDPRARAWITAGAVTLLAVTALHAWIAFRLHPVGDHYSESDFYGGYAAGAEALAQGRFDPARYGIVGPLLEVTLAPAVRLGVEPFAAARAISVLSALAVMGFLWATIARRFGGAAALCSLLLLAATPAFTRHAYSAGTDMLALGFEAGALWALLGTPGRPRAGPAGLLGALSTLTRYSGLHLLPAGLAVLAFVPVERGTRPRAVRRFAMGFLVPLAAWSLLSLACGVAPARHLVGKYPFYAVDDASRNHQDAPVAAGEPPDAAPHEPRLPANLARLWTGRLSGHAARDVSQLFGPALAILAAAGLLLHLRGPHRALPLALAVVGVAVHLALIPSFYSERYRLALVPIGAGLAGSLAAVPWRARAGPWLRGLALAALVGTAAWRGAADLRAQRAALAQQPLDVLAVAPRLADAKPRRAPVISRKGHIGYYTGRPVVSFPRVGGLDALAARARSSGAGFLYLSWYEAQLRPEFAYLLDTTASVPGLTVVATSPHPPAVAYRIGPGFGRDPRWMSDPVARRVHLARARLTFAPDSAAAVEHTFLATNAMAEDHPAEALVHAQAALRIREDLDLAWTALGWAQGCLGHDREAVAAFERSWTLHPGGAVTEGGLLRIATRLDARIEAGRGSPSDRELLDRIHVLQRPRPGGGGRVDRDEPGTTTRTGPRSPER